MATPRRKQFDYYITNLDWGDGSDLEFVSKPKLFDRSFDFEHTYNMPGYYTIKGLVFKYALLMQNLYPPISEADYGSNWTEHVDSTAEDDELYPGQYKYLKSVVEEEQYIRLGGFNISEDFLGVSGSAVDGIQYTPSSKVAFQITKPGKSATKIGIFLGGNSYTFVTPYDTHGEPDDVFYDTIQVKIGSPGTNDGSTNTLDEAQSLYVKNRTNRGGAVMNVNVHMDPDNNSLFQYSFEAWLPNFGRHSEASLSPAPTTSFNPPALLNPPPPPDGYLQNTSGNAQTIEPQPPDRGSQITSTYNLEFFDGDVGTTTAFWGGEGAWVVTNASSDFAGGIYEWSPNLNALSQYTQDGVISDDGLWEWNYVITPTNPGEGVWVWREDIVSDDGLWLYDGSQWIWQENVLSDDQQWIYDGTEWIENPDFNLVNERDVVNNPTNYFIRIVAVRPNYDGDGNPIYNSPNFSDNEQITDIVVGTNSWQKYSGEFFASDKFIRLWVEIRQRDLNKDFPPLPVGASGVFVEQYGGFPFSFYLKNIEMKFQNNSDLKLPLEWERFKSNMVINSSLDYESPMYEKNNFLMIGGLTKNSFHFKTLASLAGYDYETLELKPNFNYDQYNPYDVVTMLDTIAKYDSSLYSNYLDPYSTEIQDENGNTINRGVVDKKWHGTFEESFLTDTDISTTKIFKGVKPMWEQLGFTQPALYNDPSGQRYWKKIHKGGLEDRIGITERDLPDPMKGALTPRTPRVEYIVNAVAAQSWTPTNYWPNLPKFDELGVFSEQNVPGKPSDVTYGDEDGGITNIDESDPNLIFQLDFIDDEISDRTDNFIAKLVTDFTLYVDSNKRVVKKVIDYGDPIETEASRQAF